MVWNVTDATGRFQALRGGNLSGGGLLVLDGPTFNVVSMDEKLMIAASEDG